ncbi:DUF1877 family protein [Streptantibioticus rubrisoli]|uniref:YfbM family protein n=1 Tax=Streptantibioticus rubrisoli TaxID=1387313 RepID=A0ABT1PKU1_9ACTN|nr:DUF1877 family protein [Streptantibioticus rubrisoli]MCQ4045983.1 YfbM family protein [Streptantibioticus rubrisoli]
MGIWTWLFRMRPDDVDALLAQPDGLDQLLDACFSEHPQVRPVAQMDTHRVWHAIHVLLTGKEGDGADPPASHVVWDGHRLSWGGGPYVAETLLRPDQVRKVADYLDALDFDELLHARAPAMRNGELWVYSFTGWNDGLDLIESGALARTFNELRTFYRAAARAGDVVCKSRG